VTYSSSLFYCDLSYDDCLSPVLLNKSDTSKKCITNVQLVVSRILPLISFLLQIFLVRELFSLSGDHHHVVIYALWIASMIIFIGMIVTIYLSSFYHDYITIMLYWTGSLLILLSFHNMITGVERLPSSSHGNKIVVIHRSKRNHNLTRAWEELP